jgi:hypothetical protein
MSNEAAMKFGSLTTVISHAATLTSGSNTYDGGSTTVAELDNSVNLYPYGLATLTWPTAWSVAPAAGSTIDLYGYITQGADGAAESPVAAGTSDVPGGTKFFGSFVMEDVTAAGSRSIVISLEGVQKAKFLIKNSTAQSLVYSATPITVKIKPFTYAPAA